MTKRFFLIIAVFSVCVGGTYFLLKPNSHKQVDKALTHLKRDQFSAAESVLSDLSSSQLSLPAPLYRVYIEQARGKFDTAEYYLKSALKEVLKGRTHEAVSSEIILAQAANAYFQGQDLDISPLLDPLSPQSHPFLDFFKGLSNYLQEHYREALKAWNTFDPNEGEETSPWMAAVIEKLFPLNWRQLHMAHCLTEEGDILTSREILEKGSREVVNQNHELHHLATLFLGLTYLKESHQIPIDQRGSYYKLARFYFERAKLDERYASEKGRIITHLENETQTLLLTSKNPDSLKWGLDFVHTLQEWKALPSLERISQVLANKMLHQKGQESLTLCTVIRNEFLGTSFHTLLTQKLLAEVAHGIKDGETEDLFEFWSLVETLSETPQLAAKQIASLTSEEIFNTINKDDKLLTRTNNYVKFWEKLGRNQYERTYLARELLFHAKLFWHNEKQEKKGQRLMDMALVVSEKDPEIQREIELFLTTLYSQAEDSNMIRRLRLIFDAMEYFQISRQELVSKSTIANHLADAEYLYGTRNFSGAHTQALWVLRLDPQNEGGLRLAGLCSFHLGEYNQALKHLMQVRNPDDSARKALMLSQAFASQEQEKHLCTIDNTDSFDEDE